MASQSSQRKSDSNLSRDDVSALLRDGAAVRQPSGEMLRTARLLKSLGLLMFTERQFVRCADPQDGDFRYARNRYCSGRIYLDEGLDESGHDFRCPDCERPVFPHGSTKRRHSELRVALNPEGIHAFVAKRLSGVSRVREVCTGVFGVDIENTTVHVCVVDICADRRHLACDRARFLPTLFLCVDESAGDARLLKEDWLASLRLADVVCGVANLSERISDLARQGPPPRTQNLSVPVYQSGPPPIRIGNTEPIAAIPLTGDQSRSGGTQADGVPQPNRIVFRGREYDCELTKTEVALLKVVLLRDETPLELLMHTKPGAVWREPYSAAKRPKIRSALSRLTAKLLKCNLLLRFGLRHGQGFVYRQTGSARGDSRSQAVPESCQESASR
ncbi:MAG: hypothetical protein KJZ69_17605 [Phycisphaerales bacterium]|nr:hypothetical protein [Phycisphaerales bacterium]